MQFDENRKILIIEDNPVVYEMLREILENEGYDVVVAATGAEAIRLATKYQTPALILLDLGLPDMSGYDVYVEMKQEGLVKSVPIVVLTVSEDREDELHCLDMGVTDYLTKSNFNAAIIKTRIKNILEAKHLRERLERREDYFEKTLGRLKELTGQLSSVAAKGGKGAINEVQDKLEHLASEIDTVLDLARTKHGSWRES